MKLFVVALCLGVAYAEISLQAVFQAKWNNFKATHGKEYHRRDEPKRLNAFLANSLTIESHNERFAKGLESFQLGHNQFSDLTLEEFKEKYTGLQAPPPSHHDNCTVHQVLSTSLSIPSSIDWKYALPPVKNQGSCGSCYAFASLAPLEAQVYKKTKTTITLAEQEIVDCTNGKGNSGCNGGWMTGTYDYIKSKGGVNVESSYPYKAVLQTCKPAAGRQGKITSYVNVNNEAAMTNALATVGPLAIALQAGVRSFQMYTSGIYNDPASGSGGIDHGVTAVGYGTQGGVNYYVIRNSWGNTWGEQGHMRIARTVKHVANYGFYPVM